MSGWPVSGSGLRASISSTKSSGVRTKNVGRVTATMSVFSPSGEVELDGHAAPVLAVVGRVRLAAAVGEAHRGAVLAALHVGGAGELGAASAWR